MIQNERKLLNVMLSGWHTWDKTEIELKQNSILF